MRDWFQALGETRQGILLMILAVATLTGMDSIAKALTQTLDPLQVVWARYTSQSLFVLMILAPRLSHLLRTRHPFLHGLRSIVVFSATYAFFTAVSKMGLADAVALFEINPLLITILAFLVLKEPVGIRRFLAVTAGLAGALIIVRPGSGIFQGAAIFPMLAAFFYACYAVSTRFLGRDENVLTALIYSTLFGTLLSSAMVPTVWQTPTLPEWTAMAAMGVIGTAGQWLLIRAFVTAEAGIIAPFSYLGLVFAIFVGFVFFGEWPDPITLLGAAVIVGAGLYVWHREQTLAKAQRADLST